MGLGQLRVSEAGSGFEIAQRSFLIYSARNEIAKIEMTRHEKDQTASYPSDGLDSRNGRRPQRHQPDEQTDLI